jgi:hypothetical protein
MIRALLAAAAGAVLPGYFWAAVLRPTSGLAERLAYSTALSMALVPPVAVLAARLAGAGVTLWVALVSVFAVSGSGLAVLAWKGRAEGPTGGVLRRPGPVRDPRILAAVLVALVLLLIVTLAAHPSGPLVIVTAVVLVITGVLAALPASRRGHGVVLDAGAEERSDERRGKGNAFRAPPEVQRSRVREGGLALVLVLTGYRAYAGIIGHDWPYLRGGDEYSHAVMAEQMLTHGSYGSYLVYPPGFSTLTAVICRFAALTPLKLFPVLAPTLLLVTALGAYALAARLWGWELGIVAALLSGLVLTAARQSLVEGRYPDLLAGYFLIPMAVAALLTLFASASVRSGALAVLLGASVVFYHSVTTLYLAVLLAGVAAVGLPYLVFAHRRRDAAALLLSLAAIAVLAGCYAAYVYNLPKAVSGNSASATAVSIALASQQPATPLHLLSGLSPPIVLLGLFGTAVLATGLRHADQPAQVLGILTVVAWCVLMYTGSRAGLDGFPQRFERDAGAPLTVTAALGTGLIAQSLAAWRVSRRTAVVMSAAAAAVAVVAVVAQAARDFREDMKKAHGLLTRPVAAAGQWLARHNDGGNIISTPEMTHGITNRAVLALGGYTGLQSYPPNRIAHPRSLPPAGRKPLLDTRAVLLHPGTCGAATIISRENVRYVVLYKPGNEGVVAGFRASPARYRTVFENPSVVIYQPMREACAGS